MEQSEQHSKHIEMLSMYRILGIKNEINEL